jgi:hypothetical protein
VPQRDLFFADARGVRCFVGVRKLIVADLPLVVTAAASVQRGLVFGFRPDGPVTGV